MRPLFLLLVVLAFSSSCHRGPVEKDVKKKSIIFVCDNVDSSFINTIKSFKENIVERFPNGYLSVNIDIYLTSAQYQENNHYSAYFTKKMLKNKRRPEYNQLLEELEKSIKPTIPNGDKSIINSLSDAFKQINDPNIEYIILFNSDLLENSGTYSSDTHKNEGWLNGNFRFITDQGVCQPLELTEAEKQLNLPESPVMRGLALDGKYKVELYNISNKMKVYSANSGCDRKRIIAFWKQLFEKAGIKSAYSSLNMRDVPFFKS